MSGAQVKGAQVNENTQAHGMGKRRGENLCGTHVVTSYWCITLEQFVPCLELLMCRWLEIFNGAYTGVALKDTVATQDQVAT